MNAGIELRSSPVASGFHGPFPLSLATRECLDDLIAEASAHQDPRNLHHRSPLALRVIRDGAITDQVRVFFGSGYKLWRTNFFQRKSGEPHPGVAWHHDKHFQDGDAEINYQEVGDHVSILIAMHAMGDDSGLFHYIPGSHTGFLVGCQRDRRPYFRRPLEEHFLSLPDSLAAHAVPIPIPAAHFCLFHSALLHCTTPSRGTRPRLSMVGRLVRSHCRVPLPCADEAMIVPYC